MTLSRIDDHADQATELLIDQYRGRPRMLALLLSYVRRCQELENAAWDVIVKRLIDTAVDAQLDTIGGLVGQGREGLDDADYRVLIRATIAANVSLGRAFDILNVLRLALGDDNPIEYAELYPATVLVQILGALDFTPAILRRLIQRSKPAGVRIDMTYPPDEGDERAFTFAGSEGLGEVIDVNTDEGAAHGFASTEDTTTGGAFVGLIY